VYGPSAQIGDYVFRFLAQNSQLSRRGRINFGQHLDADRAAALLGQTSENANILSTGLSVF
jgi:hypothetical protein